MENELFMPKAFYPFKEIFSLKKVMPLLVMAIAICNACTAQEDSQSYYYKKAYTEDSLDNDTAALADFSRCIQLDPAFANSWVARGNVRCKLKDYSGSLADCDKGLELDPDNAIAYNDRATAYIHLEDYKLAIADCNKAIQLNPRFTEAFLNRASSWYLLGNVDKCSADIDSARRINPEFFGVKISTKMVTDYYSKNGWEKYGKNEMYPEAIAEYKKGLTLNDTCADLWYILGGAYYSNKQYAEAKEAFKKALKLEPDNDNAKKGLDAAEKMTEDGH